MSNGKPEVRRTRYFARILSKIYFIDIISNIVVSSWNFILGSLLKIIMSKNLKDFQKVPNVPKESKMIQKEFQIIQNNIGGW